MKVLYLVPDGRRVGDLSPHSFIDEEIEGLAEAGVEAYVLSKSVHADERRGRIHVLGVSRGSWRERARVPRLLAQYSDAFPGRSLPALRKAFHALRLEMCAAELIRSEAIDLVHSHFGCAFGLGGMVAARETNRPLVTTIRGMDILVDASMGYGLRRDPSFDKAVHALLRRADITTYATDFMRAAGIRLGAAEERAVTIRKGVDLTHFGTCHDRIRLRQGLGFRRPMILTVADLIPRKGIDVILTALARLRETHDFDLVICGEGAEESALRRLSRRLGLQDRTRFMGWIGREEIPRYFAACDVFVLGSHLEAAGNVLLEAMSAARPVICTESGGPPEYVRDGVSGFVVPSGDAEGMARGIRVLLDDPGMADRLGRAGREIAERDYRYARMIQAYLAVSRRSLAHAPAPPPSGARKEFEVARRSTRALSSAGMAERHSARARLSTQDARPAESG